MGRLCLGGLWCSRPTKAGRTPEEAQYQTEERARQRGLDQLAMESLRIYRDHPQRIERPLGVAFPNTQRDAAGAGSFSLATGSRSCLAAVIDTVDWTK